MFPTSVQPLADGSQAAAAFHVGNVVNSSIGCVLNFDGIDVFELSAKVPLLASVTGYYNVSIPMQQMGCQGAGARRALRAGMAQHLNYVSAMHASRRAAQVQQRSRSLD